MKFINRVKSLDIIIYIIFIVGILVRIVGISKMPNALNCDEASSGYEAYSILKYGIDRNGNQYPVFLKSWGSGQNALLTYLIIPFVAILGLNELAVRLPMAILGCISLVIFYLLLKKIANKKLAIVGLAFFVICPWHILKSRWGLESNLFPDIILLFVYFLIKGIEDKNNIIYYLSFVLLGLSAYSYGTSYMFLPLFSIPLLIMLLKKQKITKKQAIISFLIIIFVALPIIIYVLINTFNLEQINLKILTIPKLNVNRYKEITSIFSLDFFKISFANFAQGLNILIWQTDGLGWNSIFPYGTIYLVTLPFFIIGMCANFLKKQKSNGGENKNGIFGDLKNEFDLKINVEYSYIFNLWFLVSVILMFVCDPNINRLNIIMFPIVYYSILGIYKVAESRKKVAVVVAVLYILNFSMFLYQYKNQDFDEYFTFEKGLKEVVEYVENSDAKQIYITDQIHSDYIYVLFYSNYDVNNFVQTVEYYNENVEFRKVKRFGRYNFINISKLENNEEFERNQQVLYVIKKSEIEDKKLEDLNKSLRLENLDVKEFENYVVIGGVKN